MPRRFFTLAQFPYTFPFTLGVVTGIVEVGDYEPVWPIEYVYTLPYYFGGTIDPPDYISPPESWQNLSTWLMPEYGSEVLHGEPHNMPYFFQQLSAPTFLPDGTAVTSPTSTKPSPGIGSGLTKTERV